MNTNQTTTDTQNQRGFDTKGYGCGGPFSNFFGGHAAGSFGGRNPWKHKFGQIFANRKAANIEEDESSFKISLYAAGLIKSNFKVSVNNDVLTIAYNVPETNGGIDSKYTYQEYAPASFARSFQLNGKVLTDSLSATYTDGVLTVTLPKNPDTNKPGQQVDVI